MNIPKNLNLYWLGFTGLGIWFLFIRSLPLLIQSHVILQDGAFASHLLGAYTIYLACIFNTMFTPSTLNGKARPFHLVIGRIGMIAGLLAFIFGAACAWWPTRDLPPTTFAIGITAAGAFQVFFQILGYRAIKKYQALKEKIMEIEADGAVEEPASLEQMKKDRDQALVDHISNMVALFVIGCSTPGLLRLIMMVGAPPMLGLIGGIVCVVALVRPYINVYTSRMKPSTAPDEEPLLVST
jgi:hypothetical protein